MTLSYIRIWFLGMPMIVIPMVGNNAIRATGDARTPGLIMAVSATVNMILDPLLIFGLWGLPKWGIVGAAVATIFGRTCSLIASVSILAFRKRMLTFERLRLPDMLRSWRELLYIGLPAAMTNTLGPITMGLVTRMVAGYGTAAVAAAGAGGRIDSVVQMVLASLASVMMPFVGQNWGAGHIGRVREAHRWCYRFALSWGLLCYAVLALLARPIAHVFSKDPHVIDMIALYLHIIPACHGLAGIWRMVSGGMNAIRRPMSSVKLNILALILLALPLAALGSRVADLGGLFGGIAAGNIIAGVVAIFWARKLHDSYDPASTLAAPRATDS